MGRSRWHTGSVVLRGFSREPHQRMTSSESAKKTDLLRTYGLTPEEYNSLWDKQNGGCVICGSTEKKLCVDHCHNTGVVRGLLCTNCNQGLGQFKDDPGLLRSAATYLESI